MTGWLREYLTAITSVALISAALRALVGENGTPARTVKFISGLLICLTVVSPVLKLTVEVPNAIIRDIQDESELAAARGSEHAKAALGQVIKERTEAYILDKAASCNLELEAEVTLSQAYPPVPEAVCLVGQFSAYGRQRLSNWLEQELGIGKEAQIWISKSG